jgi:hypothetical protein
MKKSGVALGMAVLVAIASVPLLLNLQHTPCEERAPLTVVATLAAFVIAFCFRSVSAVDTRTGKVMLIVALVITSACLFADARFVLEYRAICNAPFLPRTVAP